MKVVLKIQRYNPEQDKDPFLQDFEVQVEPTDRVLDALMYLKRNVDGTLAFRKSCAHGVCGSDAMVINGKERLACKTLIQDVAHDEGSQIVLQPLKHLPLQRDLLVDPENFFDKYRVVSPFLVAKEKAPEREYVQSQDERDVFDDPTKCILCSACYSACPVLDKNDDFIGPAAIVQAARFVKDTRDIGIEPRLDKLDDKNGVWPCQNHFECTRVCPREIKITKLINETKRTIKQYREPRGGGVAETPGGVK